MKQEKSVTKRNKTFIIIGIVLMGLILFDLTPFGGTMKYYAVWMSCGRKPVVGHGSGYFNAHAAYYSIPSSFQLFPGDQDYFCTPYQAEKAGYSASEGSYSFPHLKPEENPFLLQQK